MRKYILKIRCCDLQCHQPVATQYNWYL